jgi:hypothetical protein
MLLSPLDLSRPAWSMNGHRPATGGMPGRDNIARTMPHPGGTVARKK